MNTLPPNVAIIDCLHLTISQSANIPTLRLTTLTTKGFNLTNLIGPLFTFHSLDVDLLQITYHQQVSTTLYAANAFS